MMKPIVRSLVGGGLAASIMSVAAFAATDSSLTGGATSLREQHADWTVICNVGKENDKPNKRCTVVQEQVRQVKDGPSQRILAVELQPGDKGAASVILVLPLGLKLVQGAMLKIDDGKEGATNAYRTCVFAGCIVDLKADDKMVAALGKGKTLAVKAQADDGKAVDFSISLNGFQSAFDRAVALQK